jgi:Pregnancy-associated plasma protein-A/Secretion system C-terminal sorting domain
VHVVWKEDAENLADSIIESQIQVLNEDFNRLNADSNNLRTLFKPVAGNGGINFQLVDVIRVNTDKLFEIDVLGGAFMPELKKTSLGGSDAWSPGQYLNIWVCHIQPTTIFGFPVGQILGFAFPPNDLDNWPAGSSAPTPEEDGVVIDFRVFGRNNPNPIDNPTSGDPLVIKGRTPTHEVGHYLGLRHIWGDGGLLGPNDCAQSDGVEDTPHANAQSDFDCDKSKNSCEQVEAFYNEDVPDLVENFMDYSREDCMNMFTKGQVDLMRNVLMGPRNGLVSSAGLGDVAVLSFDWSLRPNPSQGDLSIKLHLETDQDIALRVFNGEGRVCWQQASRSYGVGTQNISLDGRTWPTGIYFVEIQSATGRSVKKWAIQK